VELEKPSVSHDYTSVITRHVRVIYVRGRLDSHYMDYRDTRGNDEGECDMSPNPSSFVNLSPLS